MVEVWGRERERERKMDRAREKWGIFSRVFSSNQLDKWIRKKDQKKTGSGATLDCVRQIQEGGGTE